MNIKEVSGSYRAAEDYKSVEVSFRAEISDKDDPDAAANILVGKAMNLVSSRLKGLKQAENEKKAQNEQEDDI